MVIGVTDGTNNSLYTSSGTLTINIVDSNDAPTITNVPATVNPTIKENQVTSVYAVFYTDQDFPAQSMMYSIDIQPSHLPVAPFYIDTLGVISVSTPGLNYELITPPTYSLTVHMTDNGVPQKTAEPKVLSVVMADVPELLTILNMPAIVYVFENDTRTTDTTIFSVQASDPDVPTTFEYTMTVSPYDGKFKVQLGANQYVQFVGRPGGPGFDYEKVSEYKMAIMVKDGSTNPQIGILTVKVVNSSLGENPKIDPLNRFWPAAITVPETQQVKAVILQMSPFITDEDGRPLTYHITNISPVSGNSKFTISQTGDVFVTDNPGFDSETTPQYALNITVCAYSNCTSKTLSVKIGAQNEAPYWLPSQLVVNTNEGTFAFPLPTSGANVVNAFDPDSDVLTYSVFSSSMSYLFYISPTGYISLTSQLNYESTSYGNQIHVTFQAQDPSGLCGYLNMTVNILNVADSPPIFSPTTFANLQVYENVAPGLVVASFTVTDDDFPPYSDPVAFVPNLSTTTGNNQAELYFDVHKLPGGTINTRYFELFVKSPWDRENITTLPIITFVIVASDLASVQTTATVTVTILNVNDNRPSFSPNFYNWEIEYNSTVKHYVGDVSASDADVEYNTLVFELIDDAGGSFTMTTLSTPGRQMPSTARVLSRKQPLVEHHEYLLYSVARDNDPVTSDVSVVTTIRIDTYTNWEHLTNWTTGHPVSYYTAANQQTFLNSVSSLCTPCRARLNSWATDGSGKAVAILYITENTITDMVDNIGETKVFLTATDLVAAFTSDNDHTPGNAVTSSAAVSPYGVSSITRYKPDTRIYNWFLDSIEGNLFIGTCMSAIFAAVVIVAICIAKRFGTTSVNAVKDLAQAGSKSLASKQAAPAKLAGATATARKRVVTPPLFTNNHSRPDTTTSVSKIILEEDEKADDAPVLRGIFKNHRGQIPHDFGEEVNGRVLRHPISAEHDYNQDFLHY